MIFSSFFFFFFFSSFFCVKWCQYAMLINYITHLHMERCSKYISVTICCNNFELFTV